MRKYAPSINKILKKRVNVKKRLSQIFQKNNNITFLQTDKKQTLLHLKIPPSIKIMKRFIYMVAMFQSSVHYYISINILNPYNKTLRYVFYNQDTEKRHSELGNCLKLIKLIMGTTKASSPKLLCHNLIHLSTTL